MFKFSLAIPTVLFLSLNSIIAQNKVAYRIFDDKGKKVNYKAFKKQMLKADVVLFGEFHDNPISHWLELELAKDLNLNGDLVIGAEMLEADNQQLVDNYLSNKINFKFLDSAARLWQNYDTDYSPIVEYAKINGLYILHLKEDNYNYLNCDYKFETISRMIKHDK